MSLFKIKQFQSERPTQKENEPAAFKTQGLSTTVLAKSLKLLESTIGELDHDKIIHFSTAGKWSNHQLMVYILQKIGPSVCYLTTWTIGEEPMRVLLDCIQQGMITELHAVLDYRIEKRKPEAFQLANRLVSRIKLTKCHAKLLVLQNDTWNVTILGSANFSNNPRIEAGVIFSDKLTADFHASWINSVIDNEPIFNAKPRTN